MTDELDITEVPLTGRQLRSALAERAVGWIIASGEIGVRKDELVEYAREAGLINDGTPDHLARSRVNWAVTTARDYIENELGEVMMTDPKGGWENGFRHRLCFTEQEAFEEKQRRARKALTYVKSTQRAGDASVEKFGANDRFYGSNEETIGAVWKRASRDAVENLITMGSTHLTPNENPNRKSKRVRSPKNPLIGQATLL